ncbi:pyrroline-5-carboxylate reductase [Francisellaceae bacterium CB300]
MNKKICFIGGGNMAEAMIAGLINKEYNSSLISVIDRNKDKLEALKNKYGVMTCQSYGSAIKQSDVVILAIKPQQMASLIAEIKDDIENQLIITVAAGIEVEVYEKLFAKKVALARVIPNTPSSLGFGATGIYFNVNVSEEQKDCVNAIMESMGIVEIVDDEAMLDVIAACASSGPAYYLQFMEHMVNAATKLGLDNKKAEHLVVQTCLGAAQIAKHSGQSISKLRENVTSKKGITAEALNVFEKSDLAGIVENAIVANINRAKEISKELDKNFL